MDSVQESKQFENLIHSNMDDLAPKLVYADWLEERDNPLGECLRDVATCEASDLTGGNNRLAKCDAITLMEACKLVFPPVDRIDQLSEKQSAMLPTFRDAWLRVGLSCGGYDRELVKSLIGQAYQTAGLQPPEVFIELPSPLHGCIGVIALSKRDKIMDSVKRPVWGSVRDSVSDSTSFRSAVMLIPWELVLVTRSMIETTLCTVVDLVTSFERKAVSLSVIDSIADSLVDSVGGLIHESKWLFVDLVRSFVRDSVSEKVNIRDVCKYIHQACYGLHDSGWLRFHSVLSAFGLRTTDKLLPLMRLATQIGWWWAYEDAVIITPRHQSIKTSGDKLTELSWKDFVVRG